MAKIRIELTKEELQALVTLADNQFFRIKYIDPKIPGHKERPEELRAAQSAVQVLQSALRAMKGFKTAPGASQKTGGMAATKGSSSRELDPAKSNGKGR